MDAGAIPTLTRDTLQALRDIFVGVMTIREQRGLKKPVTQVADLAFWAGGMRQTLEIIANGQATDENLQRLKSQLAKTEPEVSAIITALNGGWNRLIQLPDGLRIANEIGDVIHSRIGKMGIRFAIGEVTEGAPNDPATIARARQVCAEIDNFNKRLVELHSRVLKPAAEVFQARRS